VIGSWLPQFGAFPRHAENGIAVPDATLDSGFLELFLHRVKVGKSFRNAHLV
jgi:hypothetical protein